VLLVALASAGGLAVLALLAILGRATWVAHQMTAVRRFPVHGHPSELGLACEDVTFPSRHDGIPLRGWYLPSKPGSPCILFIPGEEHHRNSPGIRALHLGRDLVEHGFSVLLFDFRARGESGGRRSSAGDWEQSDVLGALDFLQSRGIPPGGVGLLGFSLGAGVAILVAAREPQVPAVVCDSAFLDTLDYLRHGTLPPIVLPSWGVAPVIWAGRVFFAADFDKVRPVKEVGKIAPRPILFIHGEGDQVIPPEETMALWRASGNLENQVWIVPGAQHVGCYARNPREYVARVAGFFSRALPEPGKAGT
jgi:fermentation-respiration switch protein FrsA (DUF1100 family)